LEDIGDIGFTVKRRKRWPIDPKHDAREAQIAKLHCEAEVICRPLLLPNDGKIGLA
jgi:hypothetical protein